MEITKPVPIVYDFVPFVNSTIICEINLKGTQQEVRVNIDLIIYCKNVNRKNITDVIASGIQSVYTSKDDTIHIVKLKVPFFEEKYRIKSFVSISIDDITPVKINDIVIDDESLHLEKIKIKEKLKIIRKERLEKIKGRLDEPDIICEGLMYGNSGFAKAMRNTTLGLFKIGCNVRTIVLDNDNIGFTQTYQGRLLKALNYYDNLNEKSEKLKNEKLKNEKLGSFEPLFRIMMNNPMGVAKHEDCYSIGFVMFETDIFPTKYAIHLKNLDEIWTPSAFCKNSIIKSGLSENKVFLMPLGVDIDEFNPDKVKPIDFSRLIGDNEINRANEIKYKYKFLCVCGYSARKGVHILARSFAEEFTGNKDVILYLKCGWYSLEKAKNEIAEIISDIREPPLIHLDFNIYSDNVLASLYKACDAFVLPTKGEGFLLPAIESMAMELPTICTRYSGQLEFMNDNNSYLIDIDGLAPEPRCDWICDEYKGRKFAVPNKEHLKKLMRFVYENRNKAKEKGKIARKYITENFPWEKSCTRMHDRLIDIIKNGSI